MGSVRNQVTSENATVNAMSMYARSYDVKELWSLDILGIHDPIAHKKLKEHEETVFAEFLETVVFNSEGRYEVELPWKKNHAPLVDNKSVAIKRLDSLVTKLKKEERYNEYDNVFKEWQREKIIERVPEEEVDDWGHYLPHRHVVKENSTTVLRPVFDASATQPPHPSLNKCLHKGPNLIEEVPAILLRFQTNNIGVVADIKKAFLQILLKVVFGMCCSPFMLGAVINLHLKNLLSDINSNKESVFTRSAIEKLLSSFYVDNCVTSINTIDELNDFMFQAKKAMELAGFDLRGWEFSGDNLSENKTPVLGFVCPITLCPRILLQEAWAKNLTWDEDVGIEIKTKFLKWYNNLKNL
ncbi:uncharacterized protein LOC107265917, partial [Cephus cinctus]|uniref:Uncharacterized protein LOC107265917 n=1 Tax=Cephus cinctus TaxID=211228 RepID=A0AAJ7BQK1_CEPCN